VSNDYSLTATDGKPVGQMEMLSTRSLKEGLTIALSAAPNGLREAMLMALITPRKEHAPLGAYASAFTATPDKPNPVLRKMRQALKRIGAVQGEDYRWTLPEKNRGKKADNRRWNRDRLVHAILKWREENGRFPSSYDWKHAGEDHPGQNSVRTAFGSWSAGIAAAEAALRDAA
jgi:hypothetical protein